MGMTKGLFHSLSLKNYKNLQSDSVPYIVLIPKPVLLMIGQYLHTIGLLLLLLISHFSAYKINKVTANLKWFINAKSYKYI